MSEVDKLIKLIEDTFSGKPKTTKPGRPAKTDPEVRREKETRALARKWAMFF